MKFSNEDFFQWMWPNLQFLTDLVTFTEKTVECEMNIQGTEKLLLHMGRANNSILKLLNNIIMTAIAKTKFENCFTLK